MALIEILIGVFAGNFLGIRTTPWIDFVATFGGGAIALGVLFALAGVYIAIVDTMERALVADLLPLARRGAGYGALATVNSFGDLLSSVVVGFLWTRVSIAAGFGYAAVLTFAGAVALPFAPTDRTPDTPTADAQTISGSSKPVVSH